LLQPRNIQGSAVSFAFAPPATVQGQNISEVAAEFSAKHVLSPAMAQKLHGLLREADIETDCSEKMGKHKKQKVPVYDMYSQCIACVFFYDIIIYYNVAVVYSL
jgi:PIN domain nuclease of toxin-antitoxin system